MRAIHAPGVLVLLAALSQGACDAASTSRGPQSVAEVPGRAHATFQLTRGGRAEVDALSIGTVSVKQCHETLCGPDTTTLEERIGPILSASDFLPPMPILSYVVRHPEGTFVVDTGEIRRWNDDPDYYACSRSGEQIDKNLLRITIDRELPEALADLGIGIEDLRGVVLTHLHADHTGGAPLVGSTPIHLSKTDYDLGALGGAVTCRSLATVTKSWVEDEMQADPNDEVDQVFGKSVRLTSDGALRIVPTPGHTPGSVSVLLRATDGDALFIGDSAFDESMIETGELAGIDADLQAARATYDKLRAWSAKEKTVLLPAHDLSALDRLRERTFASF